MRQDQFTTRFQELLGEAQSMAVERSQQYIASLAACGIKGHRGHRKDALRALRRESQRTRT